MNSIQFVSSVYFIFTLLHFSLQLAVQSDHHLIVFSIWAALARASSNSRSLSSSLLSQSAPAPSDMTLRDPRPRPPSPGQSSSGGLEQGVSPVGLDDLMRLSGDPSALSGPRPRPQSSPLPEDLPPSEGWGLGVGFMAELLRTGGYIEAAEWSWTGESNSWSSSTTGDRPSEERNESERNGSKMKGRT